MVRIGRAHRRGRRGRRRRRGRIWRFLGCVSGEYGWICGKGLRGTTMGLREEDELADGIRHSPEDWMEVLWMKSVR